MFLSLFRFDMSRSDKTFWLCILCAVVLLASCNRSRGNDLSAWRNVNTLEVAGSLCKELKTSILVKAASKLIAGSNPAALFNLTPAYNAASPLAGHHTTAQLVCPVVGFHCAASLSADSRLVKTKNTNKSYSTKQCDS